VRNGTDKGTSDADKAGSSDDKSSEQLASLAPSSGSEGASNGTNSGTGSGDNDDDDDESGASGPAVSHPFFNPLFSPLDHGSDLSRFFVFDSLTDRPRVHCSKESASPVSLYDILVGLVAVL
jgi:hypothetical protein